MLWYVIKPVSTSSFQLKGGALVIVRREGDARGVGGNADVIVVGSVKGKINATIRSVAASQRNFTSIHMWTCVCVYVAP